MEKKINLEEKIVKLKLEKRDLVLASKIDQEIGVIMKEIDKLSIILK